MKDSRLLRLRSSSGSITAEAAISISFLVVCGFVLIQMFGFALQYQRLQTLAQESSRVAASLEDPLVLEKQITDFLYKIDPNIETSFDWQTSKVTVKLQEPTAGIAGVFRKYVESSATAPRWSG